MLYIGTAEDLPVGSSKDVKNDCRSHDESGERSEDEEGCPHVHPGAGRRWRLVLGDFELGELRPERLLPDRREADDELGVVR
jgi:hypothetical protein